MSRNYVQWEALGLALDLEDRLVLALKVGLVERDADIAVLVVVDHALVGANKSDNAGEDGQKDLLEVHLVVIKRVQS